MHYTVPIMRSRFEYTDSHGDRSRQALRSRSVACCRQACRRLSRRSGDARPSSRSWGDGDVQRAVLPAVITGGIRRAFGCNTVTGAAAGANTLKVERRSGGSGPVGAINSGCSRHQDNSSQYLRVVAQFSPPVISAAWKPKPNANTGSSPVGIRAFSYFQEGVGFEADVEPALSRRCRAAEMSTRRTFAG